MASSRVAIHCEETQKLNDATSIRLRRIKFVTTYLTRVLCEETNQEGDFEEEMFELALTVILFGVVQNDFVSEDHATRIEFTRSCIRFALVLLGVMCIMHSKRVLDILRNFLFRTRANSMDAAMFRIIVAFILLEKVGFSMPYWRSDFIIPPETLQNPPLSFRSTLDVCPMSVCLQPGLQISFVSTLFLLFGLFTSLSAFSMYLCYCNIFTYSSS